MSLPRPESRLRRHLLWRIHRRYQTVTRTVRLGGLSIDFTRIADPDRVLDEVAAEEDRREKLSRQRRDGDELHLPYWAELWDSALGIGQFLTKHHQPVAGQSVLDLGCGMGLSGTIAARLGARVHFADLEPPALLFARLNSLLDAPRVRARRLNWQTDRLDESFDLILGADILYERKQWEFLDPFWRVHLAPGGVILLGEPGRQTGDLFVEWIVQRGWKLTAHEEPVETRERPIRIFELRE
ncbi:MAG: class I SAM-dependent methyltransferase [Tepidisphaeraceae bacterium]